MERVIVNSIGLLNSTDGRELCSLVDDYVVDLDPPDNTISDICACHGQNFYCIGIGNCLTLCTNKAAREDDVVDVELNDVVQALCWDRNGTAILAADASGTLHFISSSGTTLFSRKILPGTIFFILLRFV